MRCLVTGATGFVGRHLAAELAVGGHEVVGLARAGATRDGTEPFPLYSIDLRDVAESTAAIRDTRPDWLFHLAGYASPGASFREPDEAWAGNLEATRRLYEAVLATDVRPRILFVSSGLVYGDATAAVDESAPLRPASPYAASKAAADLMSYQAFRNHGLDIVRVRPFNQIGPRQSPDYAVANFARQVVAAELGGEPVIRTRDLSGQRDLTDVRDMVRAYVRLLEVGRPGEVYNAGSGRTWTMREILHQLVGLASVKVTIAETPDTTRAGDTAVSLGDTRRLREETGWRPTRSLEQTLGDMLDDWRAR